MSALWQSFLFILPSNELLYRTEIVNARHGDELQLIGSQQCDNWICLLGFDLYEYAGCDNKVQSQNILTVVDLYWNYGTVAGITDASIQWSGMIERTSQTV
jgi:hypothetical protein